MEATAIARQRLEQIVENGKRNATPVLSRIMSEAPTDTIERGQALTFGREANTLNDRPLHEHAFGQLLDRAKVPRVYANELRHDSRAAAHTWKADLLAHIINEHLAHDNSRYLVRTFNGQVRGILSDRFRRLDSRPLLEAFVDGMTSIGAVPYEGIASDVRTSVRAIVPVIHEPIAGEAMVFGLHWHNSDYGAGTYSVNAFAMRLVCLNGMMGETSLRQVHLGRRLDDNLEFSAETYRADTRATALATRDIVKALLSPRVIEAKCDAIRGAHNKETTFEAAFRQVGSILGKHDKVEAKRRFEGNESVMLPVGRTAWRASNVLSWMANETEDTDKKLALQEAANTLAA